MTDILITREAAAALTGAAFRDRIIPIETGLLERLNDVRHFGETFSETLIRLAKAREQTA